MEEWTLVDGSLSLGFSSKEEAIKTAKSLIAANPDRLGLIVKSPSGQVVWPEAAAQPAAKPAPAAPAVQPGISGAPSGWPQSVGWPPAPGQELGQGAGRSTVAGVEKPKEAGDEKPDQPEVEPPPSAPQDVKTSKIQQDSIKRWEAATAAYDKAVADFGVDSLQAMMAKGTVDQAYKNAAAFGVGKKTIQQVIQYPNGLMYIYIDGSSEFKPFSGDPLERPQPREPGSGGSGADLLNAALARERFGWESGARWDWEKDIAERNWGMSERQLANNIAQAEAQRKAAWREAQLRTRGSLANTYKDYEVEAANMAPTEAQLSGAYPWYLGYGPGGPIEYSARAGGYAYNPDWFRFQPGYRLRDSWEMAQRAVPMEE